MNWQVPTGLLFITIGTLYIVLIWLEFILAIRAKKNTSLVPPIGGVLLCIGLFLVGFPYYWAWVGLLVDPGTLLLLALPGLMMELWSSSNYCRVKCFESTDEGRRITVSLYKNSTASILFEYNATNSSGDETSPTCVSLRLAGSWTQEGEDFQLNSFPGRRFLKLVPNGECFIAIEVGDNSESLPKTHLNTLCFKESSG
ncbi:MAG: hypothetical protein ACE37H_15415 [Phycisphaeraceae bacterium]